MLISFMVCPNSEINFLCVEVVFEPTVIRLCAVITTTKSLRIASEIWQRKFLRQHLTVFAPQNLL